MNPDRYVNQLGMTIFFLQCFDNTLKQLQLISLGVDHGILLSHTIIV